MMKKYLIGFTLLVITAVVSAATLKYSWINATTNLDGSSIPASGPGSIASTIITYGSCNSAGTDVLAALGTITTQGTGTSGITPDLPPGTYCGYAQHTNTYGQVSGPSNVSRIVKTAPTPNPPTNFSLN